jgi:hypothetical protein
MANALYPKWKEELFKGTASALLTGTGTTGVYVALVDTAVYTYGAAHVYVDENNAGDVIHAIVGTAMEIGTKTYAAGVFDGGDITFSAVTGATAEALVIFVKTAGAETAWRLVAFLDTNVTGLPVTPNGGDITVTWNASGIFAL